MEWYRNIMCISGSELIRSEDNPLGIMPEGTYKTLSQRKRLRVVRRGCYGTPALIEFDTLPAKYKEMYKELHGDPKGNADAQPFVSRIKRDDEAWDFYSGFGAEAGDALPMDKVKQYSDEAAVLNALHGELQRMTAARAAHGESVRGFWDKAVGMVDRARAIYPSINLPKTAISLKRKYERYRKEGYEALIHQGFRNRNSAVVNDELSEALLLELLGHGNQLSAPTVAETYNLWAKANDRKLITQRTVINYLKNHAFEVDAARKGLQVWRNKYDQVVNRKRPSAPLLLVNSDDNDLDLYFNAQYKTRLKGQEVWITNEWFRFKLYVVLDAYCDYILGYAIGNEITVDLVKEAYRNAANHVKWLTGRRYLWHQIVADHWQPKVLFPFYEKQAVFTPAQVKNARSKVIERSFGATWHEELKRYPNYAGHNITAKSKTNPEFVEKNIKNRPNYEDGKQQVAQFIERMRTLEWRDTGKSRRQVWVEGVEQSAKSKEREMTEENYLMMFGVEASRSRRIRNRGVELTVSGTSYLYDVPDAIYKKAIGKEVQLFYDPEDMTRVLVTDNDRLRFIARQNEAIPMALADMREGDRARLNEVLAAKKERIDQLKEDQNDRRNRLARAQIDAESLLQGGYLIKEEHMKAVEIASRVANGDTTIDISKLI